MTHAPSFDRPLHPPENAPFSMHSRDARDGDAASSVAPPSSEPLQRGPSEDLLLRETNHRWSNDLQLVVGLLALQSKRAASEDVKQALADAMERISILSRRRKAMYSEQPHRLDTALWQVCEALHVQAELRSISILLEIGRDARGLSERQVTTLALAVNELATNAVKHAFEDGTPGRICVSIDTIEGRQVTVTVEDDGCPLAEGAPHGSGLGMRLVRQLMASIGGTFISPPVGTKIFELRVPTTFDSDRSTLWDCTR